MKSARVLTAVAAIIAVSFAASTSHAAVIYLQDFSSAPVLNQAYRNWNSNYAGTGTAGPNGADDLNQNEWKRQNHAHGGIFTYDATNENLNLAFGHPSTTGRNMETLLDLSTLENDPGGITQYRLSFDVSDISGSFSLFASAGGGLDYDGTGNGHLFFKSHTTSSLSARGGLLRPVSLIRLRSRLMARLLQMFLL